MKTLVITSHPYPDQSRVIKALQDAAVTLPEVTLRNLESLYGQNLGGFDLAAEQKAYEAAERIVFLFPIHWFNLTPMLKAYLNEVWTYGWAFGPQGQALQGKSMQVVVSTGATAHTFSHQGLVQSTIEEVLTPMKATALYVGMNYLPPLVFHEVVGASPQQVEGFQQQLTEMLVA
ncbi:NAD(P)H-dependent oxidoreductase [Pseudomonas vanderleydeniana]|uniref:NAD(P)H-dependent oxidoreductase n=1 Tax=Pseudomonas vanderleydeniana TaxID=2745495 RepID=A0A9E6PM24_9PSED|nr:NAD(P)H-dependent oxidoreductase [Pseudomonas vanderleydeniana]QXI28553.1 NAD(P)H-dependent oxidoreductase [Pseudomonas vanderleydeniana]